MLSKQIRRLGSQTFGYYVARSGIHQTCKLDKSTEFKPVQIDVPWGKIEAKLWGSEDKQPIVAIHGWMDNAGSFDNLVPLLSKNSSILAIDLPGHGLSSWLPKGVNYNKDFFVLCLRNLVKRYDWKKVKLIGHSMGAEISYNYARLFPDETQFVVSIDSLSLAFDEIIKHSKRRAKAIDKFLSFERKFTDDPPSYPEDIAIEKWMKGMVFGKMDVPSIKTLLIRGAKRKDNGSIYFTRDFRLNISGLNARYSVNDIKKLTALITCPYMIIKASESAFWDRLTTADISGSNFYSDIINIFKANSSDFRHKEINGSHHLHMMNPQEVADAINPFIEKYDI